MAKKYIIELNEKQAKLLSWALDTFPRLIEGQSRTYQELFESAWEKRCKKATGKMMDDEFEGGWYKMREDAETFCKEIKKRFWNLAQMLTMAFTMMILRIFYGIYMPRFDTIYGLIIQTQTNRGLL